MLREDRNARFLPENPGCFSGISGKIYRFCCREGSTKDFLTQAKWNLLLNEQQEDPVKVFNSVSGRSWWMFQDKFYWEDKKLRDIEVKALLTERIRKDERRIERAVRLMEQEALSNNRREPIPDSVKMLVYSRDNGKCVKCGSEQNLEYDHIIPVSKGGSNTEKNLQLLCATCNRSKGGNLA